MSSSDYTTKAAQLRIQELLIEARKGVKSYGDLEEEKRVKAFFLERTEGEKEYADFLRWVDAMNDDWRYYGGASVSVKDAQRFIKHRELEAFYRAQYKNGKRIIPRVARRVPVLFRSRARRVRRAGRHVSRSFVTAGIDSGGGGDDGGGDGDGQSDCHRLAFAHTRKAEFVVLSARFGGLSLNDRINTIATRQRALPAQERGARGGGRFFIPLWRWAA